ncbi:MAG: SUMF1/EgtB/PvdO family nonheme iron enzyme [Candidatus Hinthialibacter antarcticus]|nr:SUMF1/EgtB/PvdO family nonheme iron enzyme [Candidatus Hinthialibacter antarcticus]
MSLFRRMDIRWAVAVLLAAVICVLTTAPLRAADTSDPSHVLFSLLLMSQHWQQTVEPFTNGDTNGDGVVNYNDLIIIVNDYTAAATSEPTAPPDDTPTPSDTPTPADTPTPFETSTPAPSSTPDATPTATVAQTPTPVASHTPIGASPTATLAPTATPTIVDASATPTLFPTGTPIGPTPTLTPTIDPLATATPTIPAGSATATPITIPSTPTPTPTPTPLAPTPDPNIPTPEPVRLWEVHRALELFLEPVIIPRIGYLSDSQLGYSAFGYNNLGDPLFISFDRFGRIFHRKLPINSEDYSGVSLADGGLLFGMFFEDPAFTRRFRFEPFTFSDPVGSAVDVDHLGANDFRWAFAGSDQGWVMAVLRFPNTISVHRLSAIGDFLGTTNIQAISEFPNDLDWVYAEWSGERILVAYPTTSAGAPIHAWIFDKDGVVLHESPISVPVNWVEGAIAGDENGVFYFLGNSSFGQRLYRIDENGIGLDRVIEAGALADIEWLNNRIWGIDRSTQSLFGFDSEGILREGPINVFPPGWTQSLAWLDLRKSGPDLGAFFFDPDSADNIYYMQVEAGPLVTPTPTPASGVPTGETVEVNLGNEIKMEMVKIPKGSYIRGADNVDPHAREVEKPAHTVTITQDFWIGKYEVTNAQIRQFASNHVVNGGGDFDLNADDMPAANVTWERAQEFCDWLTDNTEYTFSLPTEAEWEYVARAGTVTRRPWGDDFTNTETCSRANVADIQSTTFFPAFSSTFPCDDGFAAVAPVGSFEANDFGVYDMLGNVWEWCDDWFAFYSSEAQVDPAGPERGRSKIIRGGSWQDGPQFVRSAVRSTFQPDDVYVALGFRVVIRE